MFEQAIRELEDSRDLVGEPRSFQGYIADQDIRNSRTAQYISINSLTDLNAELRDSNCMVFRLGSPPRSRNTYFALAKVNEDWSDYFLIDEDLFGNTDVEVYLPSASVRSLFSYQLLPKLTETSLVNLALASGLLPQALGISAGQDQVIPATGQSVFTFDFQPISSCDKMLTHNKGQVEIDALFVGHRNGKECLFVIEAKSSKELGSLAKHKLLYPFLAVQNKIPSYMEVVPVYLRAVRKKGYIEFNIAECTLPKKDGVIGALDQLKSKKITRYSLHVY